MFIELFHEDGYAALTTAGYIACAVAVLLIVVLTCYLLVMLLKLKHYLMSHRTPDSEYVS